MSASAVVTIQPPGSIQVDQRFMATITVSSLGNAQVETVTTVADVAGSLNSTWFHLFSANNATTYYVWYNINSAGVDPAPGGTGIMVAAATGASANAIATATAAAIDPSSDFVATALSNVVTITDSAFGPATAPSNGTASPGFSYSVTTPGVNPGSAALGTAQPQLFLTSSPPQNPSVDYSSIDVYKGNLLEVSNVAKFNFDAVCHSDSGLSTYTVSAILYDSSGNSIPVTPATLTVFAVPQQDAT